MKRIASKLKWLLAAAAIAVGLFWWLGANSLPPDARREFEWFSTLGFPDLKDCPYVRVAFGVWQDETNGPWTYSYTKAFLLETNSGALNSISMAPSKTPAAGQSSTNAPAFRVLLPGLHPVNYPNARLTGPVRYELLDFKHEVRRIIQELPKGRRSEEFNEYFDSEVDPGSLQIQVFTLAWACWRKGMNSEADQLYEAAQKWTEWQNTGRRRLKGWPALRGYAGRAWQSIKERFSRRGAASGEQSFHDQLKIEAARAAIMDVQLDCIDSSVGRARLAEEFEVFAARFPNTVEHPEAIQSAAALRRMVDEDKAHEAAGTRDFASLSPDEKARELVFQLRDQNSRLQGDWFGESVETNSPAFQLASLGYMAAPELIKAFDSDGLSRSWSRYTISRAFAIITVGECARVILSRLSGRNFLAMPPGSSTGPSPARQAAEKWWSDFQAKGERQMLIDGVAAGDDDAADQAALLIQRHPADAVEALSQGIQVAHDEDNRVRLIKEMAKLPGDTGIDLLRTQSHAGGSLDVRLAAADVLWDRGHYDEATAAMIGEWERSVVPGGNLTPDRSLIDFLAHCNSPKAVAEFGKRFSALTAGARASIIQELGSDSSSEITIETKTNSVETLDGIERQLAEALEDKEAENSGFTEPRICDLAADALSNLWSNRYSFDIEASLRKREHDRIECLNVWRKARDLPLLSVPNTAMPKVASADAVKITSVEWDTEHGAKPDAALASRAGRFNGKPLGSRDLTDFITTFARSMEPGSPGIEIHALKDNDLTGVQLVLTLVPGIKSDETDWKVNLDRSVLVKGTMINSISQIIYEPAGEDWSDFQAAIDRAIAAPPKTEFQINVRLASQ